MIDPPAGYFFFCTPPPVLDAKSGGLIDGLLDLHCGAQVRSRSLHSCSTHFSARSTQCSGRTVPVNPLERPRSVGSGRKVWGCRLVGRGGWVGGQVSGVRGRGAGGSGRVGRVVPS